MYFDNALGDVEKKELLNKIDTDPSCQKLFSKEKNFRDFIKNNVKRPAASKDLIQSIRDKIRVI